MKPEDKEPFYEYEDTGSFPLIGCAGTVAAIFIYAALSFFLWLRTVRTSEILETKKSGDKFCTEPCQNLSPDFFVLFRWGQIFTETDTGDKRGQSPSKPCKSTIPVILSP